jgi:hypothetical protein
MLPQLCLTPAVENFRDFLSVNTKSISDVVQRSLAWLFSMIVDLHGDGARLAVT